MCIRDRPGGREVCIGRSDAVLRASSFRCAVMDTVGIVLPAFKAGKWTLLCQALMRIKEVRDNEELYRDNQVKEWLRQYIDYGAFFQDENWEDALHNLDPFVLDGFLHVRVEKMAIFLQNALRERITKNELFPMLDLVGFTQKTMAARLNGDGKPTSRSYFRGPVEVLDVANVSPLPYRVENFPAKKK
jgi:hypothetical protein